jgi:hypothetical protein
LSALAIGSEVTLQTYGFNMYGLTCAQVLLRDGITLNQRWPEMAGACGVGSMRQGTER